MTSRFPLVVNTSTQRIAELPAGDDLDLSLSNISNVGNITVATNVTVNTYDVGTKVIPQTIKSVDYTLALTDSGTQILHPTSDTSARTFTIPSNGTVAFPIGTCVTFINQNSAGNVSIAITSDTMRLAGNGAIGTRTLTSNGIATVVKITSTEWLISGVNLT